jgi:NitT/TauT family transport system substrate-binding protein
MKATRGSWRAALVLLVVLLAAACNKAVTQQQAASPAEGSQQIRLGFSDWPGWYPWQVAQDEGLFRAAGLDVKLTFFPNYTDSINALNAGQLDANSQTLNDTISSVAAGSKQVIVLVNDNSTGNDQIIVRPGIDSVADLKGRKVAAEEATVDHYLLLLGLDRAGLTQKDVDFQPLPTKDAANTFASGGLDAAGVFAPFTTDALARPGSKALFTSADFPGAIPDHLVFARSFVDAHPGEVQKMVDVWFTTLDWIHDHRDEATGILARRANVSPHDYAAYDKGTHIFSVEENLQAFSPGDTMTSLSYSAQRIAAFQQQVGISDRTPDLSGLFDDRFVKQHAANAQPTAGP